MGASAKLLGLLLSSSIACGAASSARGAETMAIKSGETVELGTLFWIANCRSILKGPITAEILEGPPGLSVSVKGEDVMPRTAECAKKVPGGALELSADKDIKARAEGRLTIRMTYPTIDGERQKSREIDITLLP